jgi:hypothetical protein
MSDFHRVRRFRSGFVAVTIEIRKFADRLALLLSGFDGFFLIRGDDLNGLIDRLGYFDPPEFSWIGYNVNPSLS